MHDEREPHLAAHRRLTEDGLDVQQADAAHLQQVLQQLRATPFDAGLVDAVQIHRVVGHQAMTARNQLQAQFTFAQPRLAGDHHAHAENVHEHAVHRRTVGEVARQIGPQHVDHERRRLGRGKHRDLRPLAHRHERVGHGLRVGDDEHRRFQRHDARDAAAVVVFVGAGEVGHLTLTEHLHAVRVDVVEVAHQIGAGPCFPDRHLVKAALGGPEPGHPLPLQGIPMVLEEDVGADDRGFHETVCNLACRTTLATSRPAAGPPQGRPAPWGGSDPRSGGAWGLTVTRRRGRTASR